MCIQDVVRSITQASSREIARWARPWLLAVLASFLASIVSPAAMGQPENLLMGRKPLHSDGVKNAIRLTDGVLSNEGDEWLTDLTARFSSARSSVEYDLGQPRLLRCVMVQADNNDVYFMAGSSDGHEWQQLWRVGAEPSAGMRVRATKLDTTVRYLRLSATGGDALYSVSEIAVYSECPVPWPADLPQNRATLFGLEVGHAAESIQRLAAYDCVWKRCVRPAGAKSLRRRDQRSGRGRAGKRQAVREKPLSRSGVERGRAAARRGRAGARHTPTGPPF